MQTVQGKVLHSLIKTFACANLVEFFDLLASPWMRTGVFCAWFQLWSKIDAWTEWVQLWKVIIITECPCENDDEKVYLANEWVYVYCAVDCVRAATDYFIVICSILSQVYSIFIYFSSRPFQSHLIRFYASTNLIIHTVVATIVYSQGIHCRCKVNIWTKTV